MQITLIHRITMEFRRFWVIALREVPIFPLIFIQLANVRLPRKLEHALGKVFVTPMIHRVRHSIVREEHDSNYGEGLILWDKLFGSYLQPQGDRPRHTACATVKRMSIRRWTACY